jgi:hypothetical protein
MLTQRYVKWNLAEKTAESTTFEACMNSHNLTSSVAFGLYNKAKKTAPN